MLAKIGSNMVEFKEIEDYYARRLDWRSDKTLGTIHPASNSYPDFVMEYLFDQYHSF